MSELAQYSTISVQVLVTTANIQVMANYM